MARRRRSIGQKRHLVVFQKPVRNFFPDGSISQDDWIDVVEIWCNPVPLFGDEVDSNDSQNPRQQYRFETRFFDEDEYETTYSTIKQDWRAVWKSTVYNIKSISNVEGRSFYLDIGMEQTPNQVFLFTKPITTPLLNQITTPEGSPITTPL